MTAWSYQNQQYKKSYDGGSRGAAVMLVHPARAPEIGFVVCQLSSRLVADVSSCIAFCL